MRKFRSFVCISERAHERSLLLSAHMTFAGTRMLGISKSPNQGCRVRNHEKRAVGAPFGQDSRRADLSARFDMGQSELRIVCRSRMRALMESNACLLVTICAVLAGSTAWAAENATSRHHRHHGRHVTHTAPAPTSDPRVPTAESRSLDRFHSPFNPYARPGDGNNDGLSRDSNECNKGCIDGHSG
jgi:hypothetical protein